MPTDVKLWVMGEAQDGASHLSQVADVAPIAVGPTQCWWFVWGDDGPLTFPRDAVLPYRAEAMFPPPGGYRVNIARFADADVIGDEEPTTTVERRGSEQVMEIVHRNDAGWVEYPPVTNLHRTDTVEIGYVISGEIEVIASTGEVAHLKAGDVLIQNGAPHRWRSYAGSQATVFLVSLPGERSISPVDTQE